MPSDPKEPPYSVAETRFPEEDTTRRLFFGPLLASAILLLWFFGFEHRYGLGRTLTALEWLWSAWNAENDYQHGPFFPIIIAGLVFYRYRSLKAVVGKGSAWGLVVVFLGAFFYAIAHRARRSAFPIVGLRVVFVGLAWSQDPDFPVVFLLAGHPTTEFPAGH